MRSRNDFVRVSSSCHGVAGKKKEQTNILQEQKDPLLVKKWTHLKRASLLIPFANLWDCNWWTQTCCVCQTINERIEREKQQIPTKQTRFNVMKQTNDERARLQRPFSLSLRQSNAKCPCAMVTCPWSLHLDGKPSFSSSVGTTSIDLVVYFFLLFAFFTEKMLKMREKSVQGRFAPPSEPGNVASCHTHRRILKWIDDSPFFCVFFGSAFVCLFLSVYVRYSILFSASEVVPSATLTPTSLPGVRAFAGEVHGMGHGASSSTVSNLSEEWFEGQFPEVGVNSDMSSNDEVFAGSLAVHAAVRPRRRLVLRSRRQRPDTEHWMCVRCGSGRRSRSDSRNLSMVLSRCVSELRLRGGSAQVVRRLSLDQVAFWKRLLR